VSQRPRRRNLKALLRGTNLLVRPLGGRPGSAVAEQELSQNRPRSNQGRP